MNYREYEHICVYCKHYLWEVNDSKAFCTKHQYCINHNETCEDWVNDGGTWKDRPKGYRNSLLDYTFISEGTHYSSTKKTKMNEGRESF